MIRLYLSLALLFVFATTTAHADTTILRIASSHTETHRVLIPVIQEMYNRAELPISLVFMPSKRALAATNRGDNDGELFRIDGIKKNYPNLVRMGAPIGELTGRAFVRKGENIQVSGWDSLINNKRVGYPVGIMWAERKLAKSPAKKYHTYQEMIFALLSQEIDIAVMSNPGAAVILKTTFPGVNITTAGPPLVKMPIYHYLHKKHRHLFKKLDVSLNSMINDKTLIDLTSFDHMGQ